MFRKTLIALAAAGAVALAFAPAAKANVTITIGNGHHHGWYGGGWNQGQHCKIQRVKIRHHHKWVWRKVRSCHFHGMSPSYGIIQHHNMHFGHGFHHWNQW
jgi:hypothetical protein